MVDIKNCDRIEVESNDKMEKIIQWYKQNSETLNALEFHAPIPTGVIDFKEEAVSIAYEPEGKFVRIYLYMDSVYVCNFRYDPQTQKSVAPILFPPGLSKEKRKAATALLFIDNTPNKCILKYHALMCFAAHYRNYVEVAETHTKTLTKHQRKAQKRSGGTTPLITTYRIDNRPIPNSEKRSYTKPTEQVSVRGYYRTTKTGKRVWIRPFTKYNGNTDKKNKVYKA